MGLIVSSHCCLGMHREERPQEGWCIMVSGGKNQDSTHFHPCPSVWKDKKTAMQGLLLLLDGTVKWPTLWPIGFDPFGRSQAKLPFQRDFTGSFAHETRSTPLFFFLLDLPWFLIIGEKFYIAFSRVTRGSCCDLQQWSLWPSNIPNFFFCLFLF